MYKDTDCRFRKLCQGKKVQIFGYSEPDPTYEDENGSFIS